MAALLCDLGDVNIQIPEFCLLDTCILLELDLKYKGPDGKAVKSFLARLVNQALQGKAIPLVLTIVIEECYFKLIQKYYERLGYKKDWYRNGYKTHPEKLTAFIPALEAFTQTIINLPAMITGPDDLIGTTGIGQKPQYEQMLINIRDFRLLPKDAYIVAEAQRLGVTHLITLDGDYDNVDGFTVYRPMRGKA